MVNFKITARRLLLLWPVLRSFNRDFMPLCCLSVCCILPRRNFEHAFSRDLRAMSQNTSIRYLSLKSHGDRNRRRENHLCSKCMDTIVFIITTWYTYCRPYLFVRTTRRYTVDGKNDCNISEISHFLSQRVKREGSCFHLRSGILHYGLSRPTGVKIALDMK